MQCLAIELSNGIWLYAYLRSILENQIVPGEFSLWVIYGATASTRWSILCIWYLFLCIALFNFLESNAIFTDLPFFTVITTGLTKRSSGHFSSFVIWLSCINLSSSISTFLSRWRGILRPFFLYWGVVLFEYRLCNVIF